MTYAVASPSTVRTVADDAAASSGLCCTSDTWACGMPQRMPWLRLAIAIFIAAQTMLLGITISITPPDDATTRLLLQGGMLAATALVIGLLGTPLAIDAITQLLHRRITMELLFTLGVVAALATSVHSMLRGHGAVYFDVVCVLVIVYSVGRAINLYSRQRALSAVQSLTAGIERARLVAGDDERLVPASTIALGDCVRVFPGELIPIDGTVIAGSSFVRQTPFTGEWTSTVCGPGRHVLAGTACEDGTLLVEATAPGAARRVDRLAELIDSARRSPTSLQRQADRLVRWFVPLILVICGATFLGWMLADRWNAGLLNAMAVLLVACPCAAGLATPLALWSTLGELARRGLVASSGDAIERLAGVDGVIFDKTGTLADEQLALRTITTALDGASRARLLAILVAVERRSAHPVARVLAAIARDPNWPAVQVLQLRTLPGRGVEADVIVGQAPPTPQRVRIVRDETSSDGASLRLVMCIDDDPAATITLVEQLRDTAASAVQQLGQMHLPVHVMTGDAPAGAAQAAQLAVTSSAMTPEQKHQQVIAMRGDSTGPFARPLFVGDGVNDAAAMAVSHVSIALASGAAIAVETASATLHTPDLTLVPSAIELSRRTVGVIRSNLHWAVSYNLLGIAAAAAGFLHPIIAAVLMAMSSAVVSWRSFRITRQADVAVAPDAALPAPLLSMPTPASAMAVSTLPSPARRRAVAIGHGVGLLGQALILTVLAALGPGASALVLGIFVVLTWLVIRTAGRLPAWADMLLGMISLGGLGMNLGWWADGGFASAVQGGSMVSCCTSVMQASVGHQSHWMYWGMLLLGVPAMYLLRWVPERFSVRRWCCMGPLLIGTPAMIFGMWTGAIVASRFVELSLNAQVVASYALMMAGMLTGMLIPHLGELRVPPSK